MFNLHYKKNMNMTTMSEPTELWVTEGALDD